MDGELAKSALVMVIYNHVPDAKTIEYAKKEVDFIVFVDNSDSEMYSQKIKTLFNNINQKYYYIINQGNVGLSKALNLGIIKARSLGAYWIHFLDHDAIVKEHFFIDIRKNWIDIKLEITNLGIVVPIVTDKNNLAFYPKSEYRSVNSSITSGILTNIDILIAVGFFDERLFVELVDYEFTRRVKAKGYSIQRVNALHIVQDFGIKLKFNSKVGEEIFKFVQTINLFVSKGNAFGFFKNAYSLERRKDFYFSYAQFIGKEPNLFYRGLHLLHFFILGITDSLMYANYQYLRWCLIAVSKDE